MARFTIHINESKRRRKRYWAYLQLVLGISVLFLYLFFDDRSTFYRVSHLVIAIFFISNAIAAIRSSRREHYVDINEKSIEWLPLYTSAEVSVVDWDDVRWIKQEQDGSITFNQESSFSSNLRVDGFLEEDKFQILRQLYMIASARKIQLINFGQMLSATV